MESQAGAPDDEPEHEPSARTPPPAKKSLEEFLAEFEARLRDYPAEAATTTGMALDQRAAGVRRFPVESATERPRRWRGERLRQARAAEAAQTSAPAGSPAPPVPPPSSSSEPDRDDQGGRRRRRRRRH